MPPVAAAEPASLLQKFPVLAALPHVTHGFVGRVPGINVAADRPTALARLACVHADARAALGLGARPFVTAGQIHGRAVAVLASGDAEKVPTAPLPGADGIVTDRTDVCLGIYVADCCAVFLVDTRTPAIGLVHAGKKGAALGIVPAAISALRARFGTEPGALQIQLSPCIRPPFYEQDFAAAIRAQCAAAGVPPAQIHDGGENTGADLARFYSYRMERGHTGRMLALLARSAMRNDE